MKYISSDDLTTIIEKTFIKINETYMIEDQTLLNDIKATILVKFKKFKNKNNIKLKKRDLSAYNLFMKDNFQIDNIKNDETDPKQVKMFKINAQLWTNLPSEKKEEYISKAKLLKKNTNIKKPKTRKMCGYNLYYKENILELKTKKPDDISIMKHVSNCWLNLDNDTKNEWNIKALKL